MSRMHLVYVVIALLFVGTVPSQPAHALVPIVAEDAVVSRVSKGGSALQVGRIKRAEGKALRTKVKRAVRIEDMTEGEIIFMFEPDLYCERIPGTNSVVFPRTGKVSKRAPDGGRGRLRLRHITSWCVDPPGRAQPTITPDRVASSFRSLVIPKPVIETEPGVDPILQMPLNLVARAKPVSRTTTLLGTKLQIKAKPVSYRWVVTDLTTGKISGEPIETTEPGEYYEVNGRVLVGHTFHFPGPYRIALTATYEGQYALAGSNQWNDIPGTVTTTAVPKTVTAVEYRNYLINDPDELR